MVKSSSESLLAVAWPGLAAICGTVLLGLGMTWSAVAQPGSALTPELVREFNDAGTAVEEASSKKQRQKTGVELPRNAEEAHGFETALDRFKEAKMEMEEAKGSKGTAPFWLKVAGATLALIGAGGLILRKS